MFNYKYEILLDKPHKSIKGAYQIRALRDISTTEGIVETGDLGGYVMYETNLCVNDESWIGKDGVVIEDAVVKGDRSYVSYSLVKGKSKVENSIVHGCTFTGRVGVTESNIYWCKIGGVRSFYQRTLSHKTCTKFDFIEIEGTRFNIEIDDLIVKWGCRVIKFEDWKAFQNKNKWKGDSFKDMKRAISLILKTHRGVK